MLDQFTVKPLDQASIVKHDAACGGRIVVVDDHYPTRRAKKALTPVVFFETAKLYGTPSKTTGVSAFMALSV